MAEELPLNFCQLYGGPADLMLRDDSLVNPIAPADFSGLPVLYKYFMNELFVATQSDTDPNA